MESPTKDLESKNQGSRKQELQRGDKVLNSSRKLIQRLKKGKSRPAPYDTSQRAKITVPENEVKQREKDFKNMSQISTVPITSLPNVQMKKTTSDQVKKLDFQQASTLDTMRNKHLEPQDPFMLNSKQVNATEHLDAQRETELQIKDNKQHIHETLQNLCQETQQDTAPVSQYHKVGTLDLITELECHISAKLSSEKILQLEYNKSNAKTWPERNQSKAMEEVMSNLSEGLEVLGKFPKKIDLLEAQYTHIMKALGVEYLLLNKSKANINLAVQHRSSKITPFEETKAVISKKPVQNQHKSDFEKSVLARGRTIPLQQKWCTSSSATWPPQKTLSVAIAVTSEPKADCASLFTTPVPKQYVCVKLPDTLTVDLNSQRAAELQLKDNDQIIPENPQNFRQLHQQATAPVSPDHKICTINLITELECHIFAKWRAERLRQQEYRKRCDETLNEAKNMHEVDSIMSDAFEILRKFEQKNDLLEAQYTNVMKALGVEYLLSNKPEPNKNLTVQHLPSEISVFEEPEVPKISEPHVAEPRVPPATNIKAKLLTEPEQNQTTSDIHQSVWINCPNLPVPQESYCATKPTTPILHQSSYTDIPVQNQAMSDLEQSKSAQFHSSTLTTENSPAMPIQHELQQALFAAKPTTPGVITNDLIASTTESYLANDMTPQETWDLDKLWHLPDTVQTTTKLLKNYSAAEKPPAPENLQPFSQEVPQSYELKTVDRKIPSSTMPTHPLKLQTSLIELPLPKRLSTSVCYQSPLLQDPGNLQTKRKVRGTTLYKNEVQAVQISHSLESLFGFEVSKQCEELKTNKIIGQKQVESKAEHAVEPGLHCQDLEDKLFVDPVNQQAILCKEPFTQKLIRTVQQSLNKATPATPDPQQSMFATCSAHLKQNQYVHSALLNTPMPQEIESAAFSPTPEIQSSLDRTLPPTLLFETNVQSAVSSSEPNFGKSTEPLWTRDLKTIQAFSEKMQNTTKLVKPNLAPKTVVQTLENNCSPPNPIKEVKTPLTTSEVLPLPKLLATNLSCSKNPQLQVANSLREKIKARRTTRFKTVLQKNEIETLKVAQTPENFISREEVSKQPSVFLTPRSTFDLSKKPPTALPITSQLTSKSNQLPGYMSIPPQLLAGTFPDSEFSEILTKSLARIRSNSFYLPQQVNKNSPLPNKRNWSNLSKHVRKNNVRKIKESFKKTSKLVVTNVDLPVLKTATKSVQLANMVNLPPPNAKPHTIKYLSTCDELLSPYMILLIDKFGFVDKTHPLGSTSISPALCGSSPPKKDDTHRPVLKPKYLDQIQAKADNILRRKQIEKVLETSRIEHYYEENKQSGLKYWELRKFSVWDINHGRNDELVEIKEFPKGNQTQYNKYSGEDIPRIIKKISKLPCYKTVPLKLKTTGTPNTGNEIKGVAAPNLASQSFKNHPVEVLEIIPLQKVPERITLAKYLENKNACKNKDTARKTVEPENEKCFLKIRKILETSRIEYKYKLKGRDVYQSWQLTRIWDTKSVWDTNHSFREKLVEQNVRGKKIQHIEYLDDDIKIVIEKISKLPEYRMVPLTLKDLD